MAVGRKSDYYHYMSPITLAPKVHNPWTNSMKKNIVASPYDASAVTAYCYGPGFVGAYGGTPATVYNWTGDDQGIGNSSGAHYFAGNRWDVTPGVRSITEIKMFTGYMRGDNVTAHYVEVWRDDTTVFTLVAGSAAITPTAGSTGNEYTTVTPASPVTVTIEAGKTYYVGVRVIRTTASSATPYWYASTGLTMAYNHLRFAVKATTWNGTTVSVADVANESYTYNADAVALIQRVTYTSDQLIEQYFTLPEEKSYLLARATAVPHVVKLEVVVVADGQAMTCVTQDTNGTGGLTVRTTTELDCGNSTPGQNDLIYDGHTVNLPDINPGGGAEGQEGKTFDIWWGYRLCDAGREDLYWQNRHLEANVHAHEVANSGVRGTLLSTGSANPTILTFSGTFTVARVYVGTKPLVLVGDSQVITGYNNTMRSPNANNWGGMPTALTKDRIWLMCGEAGQYLGTDATGLAANIFKNATPGAGDACEMCGDSDGKYTLGCTWFFAGIGVNDISVLSTSTAKDTKQAVAMLVDDLAAILEDVANGGNEIVIAGLPPYSNPVNADQYESRAVRLYNRALLGLALALECVYYNPWPDMVEPGTENLESDASILSLTDLACASNTTVTSATGGFTAAMVGKLLKIASGTNDVPGWYTILTRADTNTITIDRTCATGGNMSSGVGTVGEAWPRFLDAYTADVGTHYDAAGGAVVRAKMVAAMENGTIDLRDAWD